MNKKIFPVALALTFIFRLAAAQPASNVNVSGAMRNVMRMGQLYATINPDTLAIKKNLYGIGPLEYLRGEIMIYEGECYTSRVTAGGVMEVEKTWNAPAPFFVYANIEKWNEQLLPDSITSLLQLENHLDQISRKLNRPFAFRLEGMIKSATIHIVNLPEGKKVTSPDDAHEGLVKYQVENEHCDLTGFFSTEHQAVFTHHDTYIHVHLINSSRNKMGHLEEVNFQQGAVKLYLPQ